MSQQLLAPLPDSATPTLLTLQRCCCTGFAHFTCVLRNDIRTVNRLVCTVGFKNKPSLSHCGDSKVFHNRFGDVGLLGSCRPCLAYFLEYHMNCNYQELTYIQITGTNLHRFVIGQPGWTARLGDQ